MGENEAETVKTLTSYRKIMGELIQQHRGRVIDSPGDNILAEFASVVDAVQCSVAAQNEFKARNAELPENRRMEFRIGVNLGDVIEEENRIYGDGVNIAARLEALADPGGICISKTAFDHIESKLPLGYEYLGEQTVKNIAKPVGAYKVLMEPRVTTTKERGSVSPWAWQRDLGNRLWLVWLPWRLHSGPLPCGSSSSIKPHLRQTRLILRKAAFPVPGRASIAVLPFQNMTGDPQQEYFGDGMADQLITGLSQSPDIYVTSRTSSFYLQGQVHDGSTNSRSAGGALFA